MGQMRTADGRSVSDEMIENWAEALDNDEWPVGWANVDDIVEGAPPVRQECTATLTVKVSPAMKMALKGRVKEFGETTSATACGLLENALLTTKS